MQKNKFLDTLGDEFFNRNLAREKDMTNDPVVKSLQGDWSGKSCLEIGCGSGGRLNHLLNTLDLGLCVGIDPSQSAVETGRMKYPALDYYVGTADDLSEIDYTFDIVVFGFCLYLCDRSDLFNIAGEADRILNSGGRLIIYDFFSPFAYKNKYHNENDIFSFKQDYSKIFEAMPWYRLVNKSTFELSTSYVAKGQFDNIGMICGFDKLSHLDAYIDNPYVE